MSERKRIEEGRLFCGEMVRALLRAVDPKTQTRREITRRNSLLDGAPVRGAVMRAAWEALDWSRAWVDSGPSPAGNRGPYLQVPCTLDDTTRRVYPRLDSGDRMWVKETWCHRMTDYGEFAYNAAGNLDSTCVHFCADGTEVEAVDGDGFKRYRADGCEASPWISSLLMPRWASRVTLELTAAPRPERLQDISETDAQAEGAQKAVDVDMAVRPLFRAGFKYLINGLHGPEMWAANGWRWVYTFKQVRLEQSVLDFAEARPC